MTAVSARVGPKAFFVSTSLVHAVAFLLYLGVGSLAAFAAVASVVAVASAGWFPTQQALIGSLLADEDRVEGDGVGPRRQEPRLCRRRARGDGGARGRGPARVRHGRRGERGLLRALRVALLEAAARRGTGAGRPPAGARASRPVVRRTDAHERRLRSRWFSSRSASPCGSRSERTRRTPSPASSSSSTPSSSCSSRCGRPKAPRRSRAR